MSHFGSRNEHQSNCEKSPPKSSKNEMFDQNVKKGPPKSSKNEMFVSGLCSISDDWPSDPSDKCQPKCTKRPPKSSKMKCSFLDYVQFLMIGQAIRATNIDQNARKGLLSHQKMKCSFVDYIQFLMIGQAIQATNIDQNAKKGPLSHRKMKCSFWITFNF